MAIITPLKAIRPTPELAEKVASLPYDVLNSDEAREAAKGNPYSFLHVVKAEIDLEPTIDVYDNRVYEKARENLKTMISDGILIQDEKEYLYIYQQVMHGRVQVGLVTCTAVDDYRDGVIKIHERNRVDKEVDRTKYVNYCDANTGLIFLTYRANETIRTCIQSWMHEHHPIYNFSSNDGIQQIVWIIDDSQVIDVLINAFAQIDTLYVADGHHRLAAAVKVGELRRKQHPDYTGVEPFNYFLSVLFPSEQLSIMDYNRVIKDLHGFSPEEFLAKLREKFTVETYERGEPYKPTARHTFGMYLEGKWYKLTATPGSYNEYDPVGRLDTSILQDNLFAPVLGINDPKTDKRIDFIGGTRGLQELERRVAEDMQVAFSMYPTSIDEVMAVADAGKTMSPKSTWFEPKLRSGLFVYKLSE